MFSGTPINKGRQKRGIYRWGNSCEGGERARTRWFPLTSTWTLLVSIEETLASDIRPSSSPDTSPARLSRLSRGWSFALAPRAASRRRQRNTQHQVAADFQSTRRPGTVRLLRSVALLPPASDSPAIRYSRPELRGVQGGADGWL